LAEPVEVVHCLGWQCQSVAGCELGDPLPVTLTFAYLGAQAAVELSDGDGELLLVGG
jgi:hypothetical protein